MNLKNTILQFVDIKKELIKIEYQKIFWMDTAIKKRKKTWIEEMNGIILTARGLKYDDREYKTEWKKKIHL